MEKRDAKNRVRRVTGRAKSAVGEAIGDPKLDIEGQLDQGHDAVEATVQAAHDLIDPPADTSLVEQTGKAIGRAGTRLYVAARAQVDEAGAALRSRGTPYAETVTARVRANPWTAVLVAGALGYALARLTRRR